MDERKSDLKSINRIGQKLTRHLDNSDKIEGELEMLSDSYFEVVEKVKWKVNLISEQLYKMNIFIDLAACIDTWVIETQLFVDSFVILTTDIQTANEQIAAVQVNQSVLYISKSV